MMIQFLLIMLIQGRNIKKDNYIDNYIKDEENKKQF